MSVCLTMNSFTQLLHQLTTLPGECYMDLFILFAKERYFIAVVFASDFSVAYYFQSLHILSGRHSVHRV